MLITQWGKIMQFNSLDPLLFLLAMLGFFTLFTVIMYFKGLMWFQQTGTNATDNWFTSFESRDAASGGWFHRFGRPVLVLLFITLISYPIVTNLITLSPFHLFIFIFVFHFPSELILLIISTIILWRIHKQPRMMKSEHPMEDPFPNDDSG